MDAPSRPTRAETAIAVLFLVAIAAVIAPRLMGGWDFWWHMAVGREAWATRTTLPTDPFSFSFEGAAWPYKDLLAGLLFYGAHAAGGMFGVVLLRATCVALIGVAFARLGAIRRSPTVVWIIAAGAYLVAVENTFIGRPQTFSLTCLPALLWAFEFAWARLDTRHPRALLRALVPLVVVQTAWLFLHRAGVSGLGLYLGFCGAVTLAQVLGRVRPKSIEAGLLPRVGAPAVMAVWVSWFATVALSLFGPSGTALYTSTFSFLDNTSYRERVPEWRPIGLDDVLEYFPALGLVMAAGIGVVVWSAVARLRRRPTELNVWHLALCAVLFTIAPRSARFLPFGAAGAAFALLVHGRRLTATFDALPPLRRHLSTLLAAVVFLGAAVQFNTHAYGVGVVQDRYPDGALAFARAHGLDARPLNTFQLGGYVIWAGQDRFKVLIDGRNDLLYPDAFFREVSDGQESAEGFGRIANRFESTWVLASNEPGRETFLQAGHVPPWTMVYWSEPAVIYARMDAYPGLRGMAFRYLQADDLLGSLGRAFGAAQRDPAVLSSVERELARMHAASPHGLRVLTLLTLFHDARGPAGAALRDKYFADLVSTYPDHPAVFEVARRLAGRPQVPATSNDTRGNAP